jgi:hypothetical protein
MKKLHQKDLFEYICSIFLPNKHNYYTHNEKFIKNHVDF